MKWHCTVFLFFWLINTYGEDSSGVYAMGDFLLHPSCLYFKEEKVMPGSYAYIAGKTTNGWKRIFNWSNDNEKAVSSNDSWILICRSKWPGIKGIRKKTLTHDGLAIGFNIMTEKTLDNETYGEIGFYISEEFLQSSGNSLICVRPDTKETKILPFQKFKDIGLVETQSDGSFVLRGEKMELTIAISGAYFPGCKGVFLQDYRESPVDGVRCVRLVIPFSAKEVLNTDIKVKFTIKEMDKK